ncbi:MAG: 4Fe-4S dicluster domain-containing protein [Promethearchaeota archaeon]|nr:MAG: 4Fe-4S dicluster domain-containing protein [Candidatus Lokiarchaeota archaeon]
MCKFCMEHGANGKWYDNARNYLEETYEEANSYEYLEDLWGNLERSNLRKVYGVMNMKWVSKNVNKPILGPLLRWYANRGFLKDGRTQKLNRDATQGHFGQVITVEEAKHVLIEKAPVIIKAICPCKYFTRGIKEASCLGFTPLKEVFHKLPRYIPENGVEVLDGDKAEAFMDEMSQKGRINTIWCGPVPAIAALCSCDVASCGALSLRRFGIKACWKGHYIAVTNLDDCVQCGACADRCQFDALEYDSDQGPNIDPELCFGCGNCAEACEEGAISLIDREELPEASGLY